MSVTAENVPAFDLRITAVIVLYQRLPAQSEAFLTLQRAYSASATGLSLQILLYDNTPGGQFPGSFDGVEYTAAPQNGGLASAYNWAMERATENCSQWLLT